jgi:DNA-binding PadR family transcriptional regulator
MVLAGFGAGGTGVFAQAGQAWPDLLATVATGCRRLTYSTGRCRSASGRLRYIVTRCIVRRRMDLRPASYFVLASLLDGPLHGYAIAARAAELSAGDVRLTAGTLYGALDRMATRGLVQVDREETVEGRLRRYYRLSDRGREAVVAEADRLAAAARVVQRPRVQAAKGVT